MTIDMQSFGRLARRVLMLFAPGRVRLIDDSGLVQKAQVWVNDLETISNLQRLAEFGFTSSPPADSDMMAVFVGGDRANGVIVATGHKQSRPTGLKAGETMIYSLDGKQIYLTAGGGIIVNANGQPVTIENATNVMCTCSGTFKVVAPGGVEFDTPTLKSTGDIVDNTGNNEVSMASMRGTYNEHDHNDPQGGTVGVPNQQM